MKLHYIFLLTCPGIINACETTLEMDHYQILNVAPNASQQEIRHSYLKLARAYHPDKNKDEGATISMQLINSAYETLSDEEKRKAYNEAKNAPESASLFYLLSACFESILTHYFSDS